MTTIETDAGFLDVGLAEPVDLDDLVVIETEAAASVRARGLDPGDPPFPLAEIYAGRIARHEVFVVRLGGASVAMVTVLHEDADMWPDEPAGSAAYVHGLMVRPRFAGRGIGAGLLAWAGREAAAAGRSWLRLDCQADNPGLRAYYERLGFEHRGDITVDDRTASRYQKPAV